MAQTAEGAIKTRETLKRLYGNDYFQKIGQLGGRNGTGHTFAHGKVDPHEAGRVGGKISKRPKKVTA